MGFVSKVYEVFINRDLTFKLVEATTATIAHIIWESLGLPDQLKGGFFMPGIGGFVSYSVALGGSLIHPSGIT